MCQSYYAYTFLKKKFTNVAFIRLSKILQNFRKKKLKSNIICYSNKSNDFVKKFQITQIIKWLSLKIWIVQKLLIFFKRRNLFGFGHHPRKDRMPREAIMFNNCILTNKEEAQEISMIYPLKNSINLKRKYNLKKIKNIIDKIFNDYEKELKNFFRSINSWY